MKTFTQLQTLTARYCNLSTDDTAAMTTVSENINDSVRTICNLQGGKLRFLETTRSLLTVANQEAYLIPNGFRKLIDLYVITPGGDPNTNTKWLPEMIFDPTKWKWVKALNLGYSDVPYFTYVEGQQVLIQPIPSADGNTIVLRGRLNTSDLTRADYTTGLIVSIANLDTAVTGTGTAWNASMAGSYLQIAETSATNGGDGFWYQISTVTDATHLTLLKPYEGTSITSTGSTAFVTSAVAATDILTITSPTTLAAAGIVSGTPVIYTATTHGGLTQNTIYFVGTIVGQTFQLFSDSALTTLVDITVDTSGMTFNVITPHYIIGQCSVIPEAYDVAICYRATALYWQNQNDLVRSKMYWLMYDGGNEAGYSQIYGGLIGQMLANEGETEEGSYLHPFDGFRNNQPQIPYYLPFQDATGF